MRIIGCDLHAGQQTVAMLDTATGEVVEVNLTHEGNNVREFYSALPLPVREGSKLLDRCSGLWTSGKNWESSARSGIRQRLGQSNHGSRKPGS